MKQKHPSKKLLNHIKNNYTYNPTTGLVFKKMAKGELRAIGSAHSLGYRKAVVIHKGELFSTLEHRVAWFLFHGYLPTEIDHINNIRDDNRITNLREVTRSENLHNTIRLPKGIYHEKNGKWKVGFRCQGVYIYGGYFTDRAEAVKQYNKLAALHWGEQARFIK